MTTYHLSRQVRSFLVLSSLFMIMCLAVLPARADTSAAEAPTDFIARLADTAITTLTSPDLSKTERQEKFRALFTEGFHLQRISEFLLGPYRRRASEEDIKAFSEALEDNVVATYAWRFKSYAGQSLTVKGSRDGNRGQKIVATHFNPENGGPPILVEWRLLPHENTWKILDVAVEGLSMAVTQRDEYNTIIRRNGGEIAPLVELMKNQTAKLAARN